MHCSPNSMRYYRDRHLRRVFWMTRCVIWISQIYKSQYGCQKSIDLFAAPAAHTIWPTDIAKFARALEESLNPTSRPIVLRTIERCFNVGSG